MSGTLAIIPWLGLVLIGISAMQWGAARAADLLDILRGHWGLPATAGGALMGLATASPEIAVNVTSVVFGWPDLGLGTALGSNVPALPLAFLLAYLSTRFAPKSEAGAEPPAPQVKPQAVPVQVLPYLLIVVLLGALTLPAPMAGLQPIDGVILLAAFGLYFGHALFRKPWTDKGTVPPGAVRRALIGLPAIALGALASVMGAQKVGAALGISDLVTGLFVIGFLCALPEAYSAWRFTREGRPTVAISTATGDGIVSLTIALVPPALVGTQVGDMPIYLINLTFLASVLVTYIALNRRREGQELGFGRVMFFGSGYGVYLVAMGFVLTR
jgi:cation:H+ antiporter